MAIFGCATVAFSERYMFDHMYIEFRFEPFLPDRLLRRGVVVVPCVILSLLPDLFR